MKAKELMVGNIVRYDGMTVYIRQVNETKIDGMIDKNDLLIDVRFSVEHLEPLPITEEWIAKNDFKKVYSPTVEYYSYKRLIDGYYVDIQFSCSNMGDEYVNCHIDNCDRCTVASADIQYVHQLQNLLNIMNIEFDIKL